MWGWDGGFEHTSLSILTRSPPYTVNWKSQPPRVCSQKWEGGRGSSPDRLVRVREHGVVVLDEALDDLDGAVVGDRAVVQGDESGRAGLVIVI